jgi:hypothetical protein
MWEILARKTPYYNIPIATIPYNVIKKNARPNLKVIQSGCPK